MLAEFEHVDDWRYGFAMTGPSWEGPVFDTGGRLEGRGEGIGLAVELGLRFDKTLSGRLSTFLEAGYAYRRVEGPTGSGAEVTVDGRRQWEGEWGIRDERIDTPWGAVDVERPTNDWPPDGRLSPSRQFDLDLSGFQLRVGLTLAL